MEDLTSIHTEENVEVKQSEPEVVEVPDSTTSHSPDESQEPPTKKARKPFVFTEKRKEAFERCRQRREERAREKRASAMELTAVRDMMNQLKADRCSNTQPLFSTQSSAHRTTQDLTDCVPLAASNLTMTSTPINLPQQIKSAQVKMEEMVMTTSSMSKETVESPKPTLQQSSPSSSSLPREANVSQNVSSIVVQEIPLSFEGDQNQDTYSQNHGTLKRKVHFNTDEDEMIEGVGAGNHPPYLREESKHAMEEEEDQAPYYRVQNTDDLDDDTLYALLLEARRRKERSNSVFETRRTTGKMQRPSQASLFLDSVGGESNHPSQLFNSHFIHSAKPKAGSNTGFTWL